MLHDDVTAKLEKGAVQIDPRDDTKRARAMWGMSRSLLANIVTGVTKGFEQRLEITGVGYRAALQGKNLQLSLGYSHEVHYPIPEGIAIVTPKPTEIVDHRHRQAEGRPGGGRDPRLPSARALQGQGREVCGRIHLPQGRQEEMTRVSFRSLHGDAIIVRGRTRRCAAGVRCCRAARPERRLARRASCCAA